MDKLVAEINNLGLKDVELLALVSSTSYDVVFYANVDGKKIQSNSLAEEGKMEMSQLAGFYDKVAEIIRADSGFVQTALNVVKVDPRAGVSVAIESIDARTYPIKKEWRSAVLG